MMLSGTSLAVPCAALALAMIAALCECDRQGRPSQQTVSPALAEARGQPATAGSPASAGSAICEDGEGTLPAQSAIDVLGAPAEQVRFALSQPIPEFRIKLLNHLRLPRDADVMIWERTWAHGDCRLTIWSARQNETWRPVDSLHWSKDDQF